MEDSARLLDGTASTGWLPYGALVPETPSLGKLCDPDQVPTSLCTSLRCPICSVKLLHCVIFLILRLRI